MTFYKIAVFSLFLFFCSISTQTFSQDRFEKVQVLDHPRYDLNNKFVLDVDLSYYPIDAFYKPISIDVASSYQFTDFFTWEFLRVGASITNYDTKLNDTLENAINSEINRLKEEGKVVGEVDNLERTNNDSLKDFQYRLSTTAFWNLLYSKSNFFNKAVVYHYWQAGVGASFFDLDSEKQYTADLALRARFFVNKNLMLNLRGGYSYGVSSDAPRSYVLLSLGTGYAF